ncbi:MAG: hypothetical protein K8L99_18185 [Anaerolineae bacterium]|nr:hypothetical protein [Anaerolineae bacterium]
MTAALASCYEVLYQHLNDASPLWGTRVQPLTIASAELTRPYTVFFLAAGGNEQSVPADDMKRFTISVKTVADVFADALTAQDEISLLLRNSGEQDIQPSLPTHPDWHLLTVTEGRAIWIEEKFAGAQNIYHAGYQYDILMERK